VRFTKDDTVRDVRKVMESADGDMLRRDIFK
jgi:hypothetical protein